MTEIPAQEDRHLQIGVRGEQEAEMFAVKRGLKIIGKNYRKRYGEIDLITKEGRIVHFVEVKTSIFRENTAFPAEIRVDRRKQGKLIRVCETYLLDVLHDDGETQWQIDVIAVTLNPDLSLKYINIIDNAVSDF
ncbi:YraN family protein [Candidatus Parcubacteria bacterium]|nr:MAG: YraN family protein [Candidatus Parcubacteria bacterium]